MQSKILDYISWDNHKDNWIIRIDYSKYALNHVSLIVKNWIDDQAFKRKKEEWITIDWVESLDLDDAIWVEKTSNWYSVFVHISDVTEAIPIYSPLDIEALKRTTSIYRDEWVLNMFPPELSQNLLSLNEDWEKLTLSIRIDLNIDWEITDFDIYESVFKSIKRHNYESFMDDFLNPDSNQHEVFQLMYEIARKRRSIRKREWANMDFQDADRQLSIWIHEEKEHFSGKKIPSTIIEEFMILANIAWATICVKNWYNSIFRCHKSFDERAFYSNFVWNHAWLALQNYSHFTSPIRRYADVVLHRVLKIVHLRKEETPYLTWEIWDIAKYINISRTIIDLLWKDVDIEMKWKKMIYKLKQKNGDTLNTSHLTQNIRWAVWNWKKIPKVIVEEIINDLESWEKSNWAWSIWVLLVSNDGDIKKYLKKALLDDKKFRAKAVFSLLNLTKILPTDQDFLFEIIEEEVWNQFSISVKFKQKELFHPININYWRYEKNDAIWITRNKALRKIVEHFCGK